MNHGSINKPRIAYLIAGAGGMYCGSCMRDNRVVATLLELGFDVHPIPLYTPIQTDEDDVCIAPIQYGGIGLYLSHKSRLFRALPRFVNRILDSPALLRLASGIAVKTDSRDVGDLTVATLQPQSSLHHKYFAALLRTLEKIDPELIHLPNLMFVGLAGRLKDALGIPVVCTLAGEDFFLDQLPRPFNTQACDLIRRGAVDVDGFIAPTQYYAAAMIERFGLEAERVHYVPMGIHCPKSSPAPKASGTFTIGYLARISPEKGLSDLVDAFVSLREAGRDCELRAAGYLPPSARSYLKDIRRRLNNSGVGDRFEYIGEIDRTGKQNFLRSLHCLSVPTKYPEPKGLYVLEALATGVPAVLPRRGSFPELAEATGGCLLYDPSEPDNLASAIGKLMDDPDRGADLGARGRQAVQESFNARVMAESVWTVFEKYLSRADANPKRTAE